MPGRWERGMQEDGGWPKKIHGNKVPFYPAWWTHPKWICLSQAIDLQTMPMFEGNLTLKRGYAKRWPSFWQNSQLDRLVYILYIYGTTGTVYDIKSIHCAANINIKVFFVGFFCALWYFLTWLENPREKIPANFEGGSVGHGPPTGGSLSSTFRSWKAARRQTPTQRIRRRRHQVKSFWGVKVVRTDTEWYYRSSPLSFSCMNIETLLLRVAAKAPRSIITWSAFRCHRFRGMFNKSASPSEAVKLASQEKLPHLHPATWLISNNASPFMSSSFSVTERKWKIWTTNSLRMLKRHIPAKQAIVLFIS